MRDREVEGSWKRDTFEADAEELQDNQVSEVYVKRISAKETKSYSHAPVE